MKKENLLLKILLVTTFITISSLPVLFANNKKSEKENVNEKVNVLIIGLKSNVKSNFYYDDLIADEIKINADSIDVVFNSVISNNIIKEERPKYPCSFKYLKENDGVIDYFLNNIIVDGEAENSKSNLSEVSNKQYLDLLNKNEGEYILIINQHYLMNQEKPMHTVFHIISYSLFDRNKQEIMQSNKYYACLNLENPEKMEEKSRKLCSKIVSEVANKVK